VIVVRDAVTRRESQPLPALPKRTLPLEIDVVVAQLTVTLRFTRSVRYGYRRSEPL
jgi:hypothetical protein